VFGPVVMVGIGGVLAEALEDVVVALAPVSELQVRTLLERLRGAKLLHGFRGRAPVDLDAVARFVVGVGQYLLDHDEVHEVDANPVVAWPAGVIAVDALLVVDAAEDGA
jgi:acetate---CoA ligase (ADP-forming)